MKYLPIAVAACLGGCGLADVGTTAATAGKVGVEQAKQGQQMEAQAKAQVEAAMAAEQQRLRQAEGAAGN